jgi:hypothetical protein
MKDPWPNFGAGGALRLGVTSLELMVLVGTTDRSSS